MVVSAGLVKPVSNARIGEKSMKGVGKTDLRHIHIWEIKVEDVIVDNPNFDYTSKFILKFKVCTKCGERRVMDYGRKPGNTY